MRNIYLEQTEFFQIPTRAQLRHLDSEDREAAYQLASFCEVMPNWADPTLDLITPYHFMQGVLAKGKTKAGDSITLYLDTETIPYGLFISAEGFQRIVEAFHLTPYIHHLNYDPATKKVKLNKTEMKVGKFLKLLNPAISDKYLNEVVNEWYEETSKPTTNILSVKASDMYKHGVAPKSCMTGTPMVDFWDAVGSTGMVLLHNNRIVARCLVQVGGLYDKVYSYTESQKEALIAEMSKAGLKPVRASDLVIDIPAEYGSHDLPYLDTFTRVGNQLVIKLN